MMLVKALGDVGIMTVTKDRVSLDEAAAKASFERGTLLHPLSHISQFVSSSLYLKLLI